MPGFSKDPVKRARQAAGLKAGLAKRSATLDSIIAGNEPPAREPAEPEPLATETHTDDGLEVITYPEPATPPPDPEPVHDEEPIANAAQAEPDPEPRAPQEPRRRAGFFDGLRQGL